MLKAIFYVVQCRETIIERCYLETGAAKSDRLKLDKTEMICFDSSTNSKTFNAYDLNFQL